MNPSLPRRPLLTGGLLMAAGLAGGLAALGAAGCARKPFKLGFVGGLTGRIADLGVAGRDGVLLAVEQAQAAGGINGQPVELVTADDQQNPAQARQAWQQLREAGVGLVVGPMTSAMAMELVPLANRDGLLLLSPTVTTSALDAVDDQFFRVISSTRDYARASARFHAQRSKLQRLAAIFDQGNAAYTQRWLDDFEGEFKALGGTLLHREGYTFQPGMSFADLVRAALRDEPDGLLLLTGAVDAAQLMQQLRRIRPTLPVMTGEWAATEQLIELGGASVEGVVAAQFMDRLSQAPDFLAFEAAFRQRFGRPPGFAGLAAYDAAQVALQALAGQRSGESFKQTLLRIRAFAGSQQAIEFTPQGDAVRQVYLTQVRNGRYEVLA